MLFGSIGWRGICKSLRYMSFYFFTFLVLASSINAFAGGHSYLTSGDWRQSDLSGVQFFDGEYNLEDQLKLIQTLKSQGKKLKLVVGYGNRERSNYHFPKDPQTVYVYLSTNGRNLSSRGEKPYLWLNWNLDQHLSVLKPGTFSEVIVNDSQFKKNLERHSNRFRKFLVGSGSITPLEKYRVEDDSGCYPDGFSEQKSFSENSKAVVDTLTASSTGQFQMQAQQQNLLYDPKYQELFFDPWSKALMDGKSEEAAKIAEEVNKNFGRYKHQVGENEAMHGFLYTKSKTARNIESKERFTEEHFRTFFKDEEELKKKIEQNIGLYQEEVEKQKAKLQKLLDREKNGPSLKDGFLYQMNLHAQIVKMNTESKALMEEKLKTETNPAEIEYLKRSIKDSEFDIEFGSKKLEEVTEQYRTAEGNLSEDDKKSLEFYRRYIPLLEKDTEKKIEKEKSKLKLFQEHPEFFMISRQHPHDLIGLNDASDPESSGKGVVVGVNDTFNFQANHTSPIQNKLVNPEFRGSYRQPMPNRPDVDDSHGYHVSGTIASDARDSHGKTIGVAPDSKVFLLEFTYDPKSKYGGGFWEDYDFKSEYIWDVEGTQAFFELLDRYQNADSSEKAHLQNKAKEMGVLFDLSVLDEWKAKDLVKSPTQFINLSQSFTDLKEMRRNGKSPDLHPYFLGGLFHAIHSGKLVIQALGNDGVVLDTTRQHRTMKALAKGKSTRKGWVGVVNLMPDGLTINPSSNQPGNDPDLISRTLSAPGTDIYSTVHQDQAKNGIPFDEKTGTSMAAPHVTGVAARISSRFPNLSAEEIGDAIIKGATPILLNEEGLPYLVTELDAGDLENSRRFSAAQIQKARRKYGMGKLSFPGALKRAEQMAEQKAALL